MNKRINLCYLLLLTVLAFYILGNTSCTPKGDGAFVSSEALTWINSYKIADVNDSVSFTNNGYIEVAKRVEATSSQLVDCTVEGETRQCRFELLTLKFSSPFDSTPSYLTVYIFPTHSLVFNYSDISALSPEIFRFDSATKDLVIPQEDAFSVEYLTSFSHQGIFQEGFKVSTISTAPLFASLPPKEFIYLNNIGIVEWKDYDDNHFVIR